jgi:magnesium chelatase family protein
MIARYRAKLSGPLLDRIDLQVWVKPLTSSELVHPRRFEERAEASASIRARVEEARSLQRQRFRGTPTCKNAEMGPREIARFCALDPPGEAVMRRAAERLGLSARGFDRVLRVARTITDLDGSESVRVEHLQEALQYRAMDAP